MNIERPKTENASQNSPAARRHPDAIRQRPPRKSATLSNYREDPLYPRIVRATDEILKKGNVVRAIDVLVGMGQLTPAQLEDWRAAPPWAEPPRKTS
jgi:hypothetical protein